MIYLSEEYLTLLKELLIDCRVPASDIQDWELVDRISSETLTLEEITKKSTDV